MIEFLDPAKFIPAKVEVLTGLSIVSSGDVDKVFAHWQVDENVKNRDNRTLTISGDMVVGNTKNVSLGNLVAGGLNNVANVDHAYAVIL